MARKNTAAAGKEKDQSRQKILNSAFELFAQKGYAQTSVDSIARDANVSKGLIYHYFDSKEHILKAVFARMKEEGDSMYDGMDRLPPEEFLGKMIEVSLGYVIRQTKTFRLMIALTAQVEVTKGLQQEIESVRNEWLQWLAQVFKSLNYEKPEAEAYLFSALLDGVGIGYTVMAPDYPMEEVRALIMQRYGIPENNIDQQP